MTRKYQARLRELSMLTDSSKTIEEILVSEKDLDLVVARVFNDFSDTAYSISRHYFSIDDASKDSIIMESIYKAVNNFKPERGYKFHTLFYTVTQNAFKCALSYQKAKTKNRDWHLDAKSINGDNVMVNSHSEDESGSYLLEQTDVERNCYINVEYLTDVTVSSLTNDEYQVAMMIIDGYKNKEICDCLQIDRNSLERLKQGIEDVLILDELCVQ